MKYIKRYENIAQSEQDTNKDGPKIGDYVICKTVEWNNIIFENYIGQIINIEYNLLYKVNYEDLNEVWWFHLVDIIHWSPSKEKIEITLSTNKYNL